jgi:hypothetical protein
MLKRPREFPRLGERVDRNRNGTETRQCESGNDPDRAVGHEEADVGPLHYSQIDQLVSEAPRGVLDSLVREGFPVNHDEGGVTKALSAQAKQ